MDYTQTQGDQIQKRRENIKRAKERTKDLNAKAMLETIEKSMKKTLLENSNWLPF